MELPEKIKKNMLRIRFAKLLENAHGMKFDEINKMCESLIKDMQEYEKEESFHRNIEYMKKLMQNNP